MSKYFLLSIFTAVLAAGALPLAAQTPASDAAAEEAKRLRVQETAFLEGMRFFLTEKYKEAEQAFKKILADDPNAQAGVPFMLGKTYGQLNQLPAAQLYVKKALEKEPANRFYKKYLAWLHTSQGQLPEAANVYAELAKANPQDLDTQLDLADAYLKMGEYNKALRAYEAVEKQTGIDEKITRQKQQIYLLQNKVDAAVSEGSKLIATDPLDTAPVTTQAELLIANKKYTEAAALVTKSLAKNPQWVDGYLLGAEAYRLQNELGKAGELLQQAFQITGISTEMKEKVLGSFVRSLPAGESGSLGQAIAMAQNLTASAGATGKSWQLLGNLLRRQSQFAAARDAYVKALKTESGNFDTWQAVLELDAQLADYAALLTHAEKATSYFPNQALVWYYVGLGQFHKPDLDEADFALSEARRMVGSNTSLSKQIYQLWAEVAAKQNKAAKAEEYRKKAEELK